MAGSTDSNIVDRNTCDSVKFVSNTANKIYFRALKMCAQLLKHLLPLVLPQARRRPRGRGGWSARQAAAGAA